MTQEHTPEGFNSPTRLPAGERQRQQWQQANREWWEAHPMRYDWNGGAISSPEFSKQFFAETDHRFFTAARQAIGWRKIPFDNLIDFDYLRSCDVLEIGVGLGSHAQLLASHANSFTGIDLTDYAVKATSARLQRFGLANAGRVLRMDAEQMQFPDHSFDYIWSWGVIHHSADTERVLREMKRVLRPKGRAALMVYHRGYQYYVRNGLVRGLLKGEFLKTGSLHQVTQKYIDGAIARHYSVGDWRALVSRYFKLKQVRIYGSRLELLTVPRWSRRAVDAMVPDSVSRFLTTNCRLGGFLFSTLERAE